MNSTIMNSTIMNSAIMNSAKIQTAFLLVLLPAMFLAGCDSNESGKSKSNDDPIQAPDVSREKMLEDIARIQMTDISIATNKFYLKTKSCPKKLDDLAVLPEGMDQFQWGGPYIKDAKRLKDPWGNPFQFHCEKRKDSPLFDLEITSFGPDGKPEGGDDLVKKE